MEELQIRDAVADDVPRLLEIYAYYVEKTAVSFEYVTPSEEEFARRMRTFSAEYPYLVAQRGDTILGYAYAHTFIPRAAYDHCCELTIYLDKDCRRQGTGRALYHALEQRLAQKGIRNLYACIGYPEQEDEYLTYASADFHRHLGFTTAGTFHYSGFKFGRWYHMIWMEKLLVTP